MVKRFSLSLIVVLISTVILLVTTMFSNGQVQAFVVTKRPSALLSRHGQEPNVYLSSSSAVTLLAGTSGSFHGYEADLLPSSVTPIIITIIAVLIGVAAQSFINKMLEGDQGLGAFLSDGSGYNKSGFKPRSSSSSSSARRKSGSNMIEPSDSDPLPWLRLPQLDFVDVAGQPPSPPRGLQISNRQKQLNEQTLLKDIQVIGTTNIDSSSSETNTAVYEELEQLRTRLIREVQEENVKEATRIQQLLERRMKEEGIQFTSSLPSSNNDNDSSGGDNGPSSVTDNGIDFQ